MSIRKLKMNKDRSSGKLEAGFSLVEIMVGLVIAMMATLAIFQTFAVNEAQRRTTSSGSEGLQNATFAMAQLVKSIQDTGYNLTTVTDAGLLPPSLAITPGSASTVGNSTAFGTEFLIGCVAPAIVGGMRVTPVLTFEGPAPAPAAANLGSDNILVFSGTAGRSPLPTALVAAIPASSTSITVKSAFGFKVGDKVLIYEQDPSLNSGTTRSVPCTFATVTAAPAFNANVQDATITINTPTVSAYTKSARVANLGSNPSFNRFAVNAGGQLTVTNLLSGSLSTIVLADNVVSMRVQTGIDLTNDDRIDEWINAPSAATDWLNPSDTPPPVSIAALPVAAGTRSLNQIKALRIGLLVRSPQFERQNAGGTCDATAAGTFNVLPAVPGINASNIPSMPASASYTFSSSSDRRCYRYNAVNTVIPLRNMIVGEI